MIQKLSVFGFIFLSISVACAGPRAGLYAPTVATKSGWIQGKKSGELSVFLGIPYAKPPVGPLRWKAPQDPTPWKTTLQATAYGSSCLQVKAFSLKKQDIIGNEDCLYLNVWVPKATEPKTKRPVMVFLHGGAFVIGSSGQNTLMMGAPYDGVSLASSQSAVVVTFNYRLGILGFLAHPDASRENSEGAYGNYGLLDAIHALKWVQDNIENFGGDKNRVFVFGESSGAFITGALVASPLAHGLFQAAGLQSGFYEAPLAKDQATSIFKLQREFSCRSLNCLRNVTGEEITLAQRPLADFFDMDLDPRSFYRTANDYALTVDGVTLPKAPIQMVREGRHNKVPLIIGSNKDEAELFIKPGAISTCREYEERILRGSPEIAADIFKTYPCGAEAPRKALVSYASNVAFQCPARRFARAAALYALVYQYVFSYKGPGLLGMMGAPHYAEVPYIFGNLMSSGGVYTSNSNQMISIMQNYWGQFAATGNPNRPGKFTWPRYERSADQIIDLNLPLSIQTGFQSDSCDFVDGFLERN